ncbi:hypothetical protein Goarm_010215 [Gossypium armourianum]|uniref:Uncharacterized protein n=1 Tax=Gossypium armourianum TaxID=34283 RepID=A0A7J9JVH5_9ROSI|nr:hypothetical protein [Gossypium armourianum]
MSTTLSRAPPPSLDDAREAFES